MLDSNAYTLKTGSCSVYFHFLEIVFLWPPSHKWYHKQTKINFHITKFNLSDRIYPIKCIYIRIEDILWPRKILRAVKVRAIWWGKALCSFVHRKVDAYKLLICLLCKQFQTILIQFLFCGIVSADGNNEC